MPSSRRRPMDPCWDGGPWAWFFAACQPCSSPCSSPYDIGDQQHRLLPLQRPDHPRTRRTSYRATHLLLVSPVALAGPVLQVDLFVSDRSEIDDPSAKRAQKEHPRVRENEGDAQQTGTIIKYIGLRVNLQGPSVRSSGGTVQGFGSCPGVLMKRTNGHTPDTAAEVATMNPPTPYLTTEDTVGASEHPLQPVSGENDQDACHWRRKPNGCAVAPGRLVAHDRES